MSASVRPTRWPWGTCTCWKKKTSCCTPLIDVVPAIDTTISSPILLKLPEGSAEERICSRPSDDGSDVTISKAGLGYEGGGPGGAGVGGGVGGGSVEERIEIVSTVPSVVTTVMKAGHSMYAFSAR